MRRTTGTGMVLAGLLLTACVADDRGGPTAPAAPAPCPAAAGDGVPVAPSADTLGRLVPEAVPEQALLCRYGPGAGDGEGPDENATLDGQVTLGSGLDRLPQDLLLPGGAVDGVGACDVREDDTVDADRGGTAADRSYLLRLTYPDGTVWVAARGACTGTTNGPFSSGVDTAPVLAASYDAAAWTVPPLPDADQRCAPERTGRAGQEFALLPPGATELVLCRLAGDGVTRRTADAAQQAVVQDVLDDPVASRVRQPCQAGPEQYELVARYPRGPAVLVTFRPDCPDDVTNGSLQAALPPEGESRLRAVLTQAFPDA